MELMKLALFCIVVMIFLYKFHKYSSVSESIRTGVASHFKWVCRGEPWWLVPPEGELNCIEQRRILLSGETVKVGEGHWRDVYKTTWRGQDVVIKKMRASDHASDRLNRERHRHEAIAMSILSNITQKAVRFHGICDCDLATEWLPYDMHQILFDKDMKVSFSPNQALLMALDMAEGLAALHSIPGPFVHADLRPKQFLMDFNGVVKINDLNRGQFIQHDGFGKPCKFSYEHNFGRWRSPEEYMGRALDEKIDIYSLGLCLWALLSRMEPYGEFEDDEDAAHFVAQGGRPPPLPPVLTALGGGAGGGVGGGDGGKGGPAAAGEGGYYWLPGYAALLRACWAPRAADRPAAVEVTRRLAELVAGVGLKEGDRWRPPAAAALSAILQ
eukprot:CAMPEP_0206413962 /NCGR_PEP_ID=MMETSP0294-20121207/35050_1 /ASSEMBLY_ACC=CAM_ASM_000327 /TAXON_ID=39354 /ORGANISM="Heterosigma akashiwo, Strain CCMP2393" /LENGTH=384 /DNA_ID=CAMNT_0053875699 /DNA_START=323 /DNA_END=1478 /DNA_ORIENTATION=+